MKKINVLLTVCLVVGFAVFMAANASIASDSIMGKDMKIFGQGHGPGNGTGNGGSGPKDGTGNGSGQGTCTRLIPNTSNDGILISRNGSGKGQGTGPQDGSGPRGGTPSCPSS